MQALSGLKIDGTEPLKQGFVQDVAIEWHGEVAYVGVHVQDQWFGKPPSEEALEALRQRVLTLPSVGAAKIIPRDPQRAAEAQSIANKRRHAAQRPPVPEGARLLAIASGKGGVGKSTVAVNLAIAFSRLGVRAAILDCDVYGFSVPDLLSLKDPPTVRGRQMVPPQYEAVQVMSMAFFVPGNQAVMWRGPMLGKAISQMTGETAWDRPEVIVLDLPPGTGDIAMDVDKFFPESEWIVVTTPDLRAAKVAERSGRMGSTMGHKVLGVVENQNELRCECGRHLEPLGRGGGDAVARALSIPVLARVPWDLSGDGVFAADSEAAHAMAELARTLETSRTPSEATS